MARHNKLKGRDGSAFRDLHNNLTTEKNRKTIGPPNNIGGHFNAKNEVDQSRKKLKRKQHESLEFNIDEIQKSQTITYGQLDQKLDDTDIAEDINNPIEGAIPENKSISRSQIITKDRINDHLNLKEKSIAHDYTKKLQSKNRYRSEKKASSKSESRDKATYDYYTTDSDNDGVADVNDVSDYDSTVQDFGDVPKTKRNKTIKVNSKESNTNKTGKGKEKQEQKLDKKIIKKKNRLIFEENQPKSKALNNTVKVIVGASIATKNTIGYYNQVESLQDSDNNSAVQAMGKGFDLSKSKTSKKLTKLNQGLRSSSNKTNIKRLEKKSVRLKYDVGFEKVLKRNKIYNNSKGLNKYYQRSMIKRNYNKKVKGSVVQQLQKGIKKVGKLMKEISLMIVKRFGIYIAGAILLVVLISLLLSFFMGLFSSGVSMIVSTSYQANDIVITDSNNYYQLNEVNLLYAIENVEADFPDYDAYRYNVATIGHNPHEIAAYLTAKYGEFTLNQVQGELSSIFNEQYIYSLTEIIETRTRTKTTTSTDPITGEETTTSKEVEYDWYVLEIKLQSNSLEQILLSRLTDEEKEVYNVLMESKGNFISFPSPINQEWYSSISSPFGYRLDPMTDEVTYHKGVDIAQPEGTDLISIFSGTVLYTGYDADGYGNYVIIEQEGTKISALYSHCVSIEVDEGSLVNVGDIVAKVGSTGRSTGNHVHFEIRDPSGNTLNPYFYLLNATQEFD